MEVAQDPGFQYDLYIAQKEFVRYGDQDLGEILVDILVDRTKHKEKDLRQLVLSEALVTAPKLTSGQIEILACHFNITLTKRNNFQSIKDFSKYISEVILPLSESVATAGVNYKHLEFVGCAAIRTGSWDLLEILRGAYPAIFCKGFSHEEFAKLREMDPNVTKVLIRCPHNPSLYQAGGMDDKINKQMCVSNGVSKEAETALLALNKNSMMSNVEAAEFIESVAPGFSKFVKGAKGSQFVNMELTSVGIAIAHAYSRKRLDFDADLSIWI
ncbi:hypothetical protein RA24_05825 [Leisingera sp. ANG-M6]|nr:hypothetical protein RA24_05825 [Leisingera sp. ANG-M6]